MIKSIILSILTAIAFVLVAFGVCVGGTTEYLGLMLLIPVILFFFINKFVSKAKLNFLFNGWCYCFSYLYSYCSSYHILEN